MHSDPISVNSMGCADAIACGLHSTGHTAILDAVIEMPFLEIAKLKGRLGKDIHNAGKPLSSGCLQVQISEIIQLRPNRNRHFRRKKSQHIFTLRKSIPHAQRNQLAGKSGLEQQIGRQCSAPGLGCPDTAQ